ncbi:MAG TPA: hypothetical protein VFW96_06020, partial [Thermomicrobiales bacterium]|nr:hypothetical protein [Thermomicrobiales bacterium]
AILHLPGHSPGSIGIALRYTRTGQTPLIPGDAVEGAFSTRIRSNITSRKRSLRRLRQEQFDFMLPSHLPGGATTALLANVPSRLARVYRLLETDFHRFMAPQVAP